MDCPEINILLALASYVIAPRAGLCVWMLRADCSSRKHTGRAGVCRGTGWHCAMPYASDGLSVFRVICLPFCNFLSIYIF